MAGRLSRRRSTKTKTPAAAMCRSIRQIRRSSTRRSGKRAKVRGKMAPGMEPAAAFSNRPTADKTWKQLTNGLPNDIVQANLAIAASAPQTLFAAVATVEGGASFIGRKTAGESWTLATDDDAPRGRGSAAAICRSCGSIRKIRNIVYSASVVCWKSTDGGKTWDGWRGAPGGDDYQNVWINPERTPTSSCSASDQGAIITVNGGATWSSWYNQSTAQLYHVSADNAFPYRLYSGQQESGSVGITSRGPDGAITFPRLASGRGGRIRLRRGRSARSRHHLRREIDALRSAHAQAQSILPKPFRSDDFRMVRTQPVVFSPLDPHLLFFAATRCGKRAMAAGIGSRSVPT